MIITLLKLLIQSLYKNELTSKYQLLPLEPKKSEGVPDVTLGTCKNCN